MVSSDLFTWWMWTWFGSWSDACRNVLKTFENMLLKSKELTNKRCIKDCIASLLSSPFWTVQDKYLTLMIRKQFLISFRFSLISIVCLLFSNNSHQQRNSFLLKFLILCSSRRDNFPLKVWLVSLKNSRFLLSNPMATDNFSTLCCSLSRCFSLNTANSIKCWIKTTTGSDSIDTTNALKILSQQMLLTHQSMKKSPKYLQAKLVLK